MMNATMSPPLSSRSRSSSLDSSFDEEYFSTTYVPLSNLPTPPTSSHSNITARFQTGDAILTGESLDPELIGPATHLTNLIPSSTSLTATSVPLVHSLLVRAQLPRETIALACCMLDSLNSRFALQWRRGFPLHAPLVPSGLDFERGPKQHIDSIHPEIIVFAALVLAVKFLDDRQQSTRHYVRSWGEEWWTCDQLNYSIHAIHENLGYRIKPLCEDEIIAEALETMDRAGRNSQLQLDNKIEDWETDTYIGSYESSCRPTLNIGTATVGNGSLITPLETPRSGLIREVKSLPRPPNRNENEPYKSTGLVEESNTFEESMFEGLGYGFR